MPRRRPFGTVRRLPSGRYQASYVAPNNERVNAPHTFDTKIDARGWLVKAQAEIIDRTWKPPAPTATTLNAYAVDWVATKRTSKGRPLARKAQAQYADTLRLHILPHLGDEIVETLTEAKVQKWHATLAACDPGATALAHAYALLRNIMNTAVKAKLREVSPCVMHKAGSTDTSVKIEPATVAEL